MAIAEMSKCTLVALKSDKDKVYDALQRTGAAQIKTQEEREYTVPFKAGDTSELDRQSEEAKKCLDFLTDEIELLPKEKRGSGVIKDGFGVSEAEFFSMGEKTDEIYGVLTEI